MAERLDRMSQALRGPDERGRSRQGPGEHGPMTAPRPPRPGDPGRSAAAPASPAPATPIPAGPERATLEGGPWTVGEARAVAAGWVRDHAAKAADFAGAFLSGSAAWLPAQARLPATSDVDVLVVTSSRTRPPKLGKFHHAGVLLEVSYLTWEELHPAEEVLTSYHLAAALSRDTVLADPTGRLTALRTAVARDYARRPWVRQRCARVTHRIADWLAARDPAAPFHDQVIGWLFPTSVTTHVLLTAGLRNPTVRLRYLRAGELLAGYDLAEFHEELLALLGCAHLGQERVGGHLAAMTEVFDATVPLARTAFPFSADLTAAARPVAVDGGRALVERGRHREAVFWMVATYARCLAILAQDAPDVGRRHAAGFAALLADLGVDSPADLPRHAERTLAFLPRLREVTARVLAANPEIEG